MLAPADLTVLLSAPSNLIHTKIFNIKIGSKNVDYKVRFHYIMICCAGKVKCYVHILILIAFHLGYLELLSQLTRVGDVSETTFKGIVNIILFLLLYVT